MIIKNPEQHLFQAQVTQNEAQKRHLNNVLYHLTLYFNRSLQYRGIIEIVFEGEQDTFIEFAGYAIYEVNVNGEIWSKAKLMDNWIKHKITLRELKKLNKVSITFAANLTNTGFGLFHYEVDGENFIYSLFCSNYAHTAFPCFDQPNIKGIFILKIYCPLHWIAISNSNFIEESNEYQRIYQFHPTQPISTYLFSLSLGDWKKVEADQDCIRYNNIQMDLYCESTKIFKLKQNEKQIINCINFGFSYYESLFGIKFPFQKYDHIFCSHFHHSAMEHPGAVLITNVYLYNNLNQTIRTKLFTSILHELSHMWFGNLVTMDWWNDLWLNESFAVYISHKCLEEYIKDQQHLFSDLNIRFLEYTQQGLQADIMSHTHPIEIDIVEASSSQDAFDEITYSKGASVVSQFANQISFPIFIKGVSNYLNQYQFKNATSRQFFDSFDQEVIPINIMRWMKEWIQVAGVNVIEIKDELYLSQYSYHEQLRINRQIDVYVLFIIENNDVIEQKIRLIDEQVKLNLCYQCALINYNNMTYCLTNLDQKSLNYILKNYQHLKLDLNIRIKVIDILYQMCVMTYKLDLQIYVNFCLSVLQLINNESEITQFILSTLANIDKLLTSQKLLQFENKIYHGLKPLLQIMINQEQTIEIERNAKLIIDEIGRYVTDAEGVQFLYQILRGNIFTYPSSPLVCKYFLHSFFNLAHTIPQDKLTEYTLYWEDNFRNRNPHLEQIQEGTLITDIEQYFQNFLENDEPISRAEMILSGLNNVYSPRREKYYNIFMIYFLKALEKQNKLKIKTLIRYGFPYGDNLEQQLKIMEEYYKQYNEKVLIELCDNIRIRIHINK